MLVLMLGCTQLPNRRLPSKAIRFSRMQLPEILRNRFFYIPLIIAVLLILPSIYLRVNKRTIFTEYLYRFHRKKTSAITPDISDYKTPRNGLATAADFVHFKLEYLNSMVYSVKGHEKISETIIMIRFNTNREKVEKFIADKKNQQDVEIFLKENPIWEEKIGIALERSKKRKIKLFLN